MKKNNQIEYIVKGVANKTRISMVLLLEKKPELSVGEIVNILKLNEKTGSQHLLKLIATGIVMKRKAGANVRHKLTEKGLKIVKLLKEI